MEVTIQSGKMNVEIIDGLVNYNLSDEQHSLDINDLIGKKITLDFNREINCVHCQKPTDVSYKQGYCLSCSETLAECDTCKIKPELCSFSSGGCKDESWGLKNCFDQHLVYLSYTGGAKVGITRHSKGEISSRWIDQGATSAIPLLMVGNRLLSGLVESIIKKYISDKTDWRKMLSYVAPYDELKKISEDIKIQVQKEISELQSLHGLLSIQWLENTDVKHITYPVQKDGYPNKIKSVNLDKTPSYSSVLTGIKGQYLIFEDNSVLNLRKYSGYNITFSC